MSAAPLVAVEQLTIDRGGLPVVVDVGIEIAAGRVCGIVGESGAGKTMTLRSLGGLLPPGFRASGRLRVGEAVYELDRLQTRRTEVMGREIAFVTQNPASMLDPMARVGRQLTEGLRLQRRASSADARQRAVELLAQVGFDDPERIMRAYPHQLSGGMKQRAGIAQSLMGAPRLLLVDEPTSALDAQLRIGVLELIRSLAIRRQMSVLLVSHDLGLVAGYADSVAVFYAGRVVEHGPAAEILTDPRHPYARSLRAVAPQLDAVRRRRVATIPGAPPQIGAWPDGCPFSPRCPAAIPVCSAEMPPLTGPARHVTACHVVERELVNGRAVREGAHVDA